MDPTRHKYDYYEYKISTQIIPLLKCWKPDILFIINFSPYTERYRHLNRKYNDLMKPNALRSVSFTCATNEKPTPTPRFKMGFYFLALIFDHRLVIERGCQSVVLWQFVPPIITTQRTRNQVSTPMRSGKKSNVILGISAFVVVVFAIYRTSSVNIETKKKTVCIAFHGAVRSLKIWTTKQNWADNKF